MHLYIDVRKTQFHTVLHRLMGQLNTMQDI